MTSTQGTSMNRVIGRVLRYGVLLSAGMITLGSALLIAGDGLLGTDALLRYSPDSIPHGAFTPSLASIAQGVLMSDPYSVIELGVLLLLATPVARVLFSLFLFISEGDRPYVYITAGVLAILLFSMLVTPFIPGFNG